MIKKIVLKGVVYLLIYHLLSFLLMLLLQSPVMQFLSIQSVVSSDFTYNDLFYRVQSNRSDDVVARKHKENIVLINTASFEINQFRSELAELITCVESFRPKVVGIDITFSNRSDEGNQALKKSIQSYGNIVCAYRASEERKEFLSFHPNTHLGDVDFPANQHSIRFYKGGRNTFAYQIFKIARGIKKLTEISSVNEFPIAYSCIHDGVVNFDDFESADYAKNYKVIDASLLMNEEFAAQHYESVLKNGIVIIGHMGSSPYDIEDKHAVPTDTTSLVNRNLLMPGAAIHANALSNMLDNHVFHEPNEWMVEVILNLVMLLMIIMILRHPMKIVLLAGLAVFSIVWIWLAMYLMEFNIYIQVGGTLIELMILEEFVESFDPFVSKVWDRFEKKSKSKRKSKIQA